MCILCIHCNTSLLLLTLLNLISCPDFKDIVSFSKQPNLEFPLTVETYILGKNKGFTLKHGIM